MPEGKTKPYIPSMWIGVVWAALPPLVQSCFGALDRAHAATKLLFPCVCRVLLLYMCGCKLHVGVCVRSICSRKEAGGWAVLPALEPLP